MPKTVLLIDDDYDFLVATKTVVEAAGYAVKTAGSGEEGLEAVRRSAPDLIVLDVMMPGMDGWAVCETLKGAPATSRIPIIMLTAVASHVKETDYTHASGKMTDADDYFPKPVNPQVLVERIKRLIK
jgi:two-component system alkaline phosphatase synthesis response regulator PhoP